MTGSIRKLIDDAAEGTLAPDGNHILYRNAAGTEIRVMDALGNDSRTIVRAEQGERFSNIKWMPDGARIIDERDRAGDTGAVLESRAADGNDVREILKAGTLSSIAVTREGRVFYTAPDPPPVIGAGLWVATLDSSGRAPNPPQRIAHWAGIQAGLLSASTDGRRLVTNKVNTQSDVVVAEFDQVKGTLGKMRQLTTDTAFDWPSAWTPDGQGFVFYSNRGGNFDIFRQSLATESPEPLVLGPGDTKNNQITADGESLLYVQMPDNAKGPARVTRMALAGGPAQVMFETRGIAGSAGSYGMGGISWGAPGARGFPDIRCPRTPGVPCVLAEALPGQVAFSTFEPTGDKPREFTRIDVPPARVFWDLSPDGASIAYGEFGWEIGEKLTLIRVASGAKREVPLKGWMSLNSVAWAADGRHLFATTATMRGATLLYATLDGEVRTLWNIESQYVMNVSPSRDGRQLLMGETTTQSNGWLIEPK